MAQSPMASIAIDATYAIDPQPSGIAIYTRRLIESLAELDTDHRFLLCYRLSRFKRRREFLRPAGRRGGGRQFSARFVQEPLTFWLPWQAELFHSLAQRPPAFRFRREIVTVLDIFPITGRDYSAPDFQRKFSDLLLDAVARASCIITLSQYTADQLAEHCGVARARIRVIPPGVDLPDRLMSAEERRRERERLVGEGREMVLSVGVIQTRKNTLNALRALELLPENYHLVLAGGNGYGSEAVHQYIHERCLESRVSVTGYVPAEQIPILYQAADVFLFPSFEEGFGLPVLEAMAYGVPVVTSKTSALPEVGGEAALYVDPHDIREIAESVVSAVENTRLREKGIQTGMERVREFTWRRTAERTLQVYDEVLG